MKTIIAIGLAIGSAGVASAQTYTATVLNPPNGLAWAIGVGAGGSRHAGYGAFPDQDVNRNARAFLFNGSAIDVTPPGAAGAIINDSDNDMHVGVAGPYNATPGYAYLWIGSTAINVHPAGYTTSELLGVGGGKQVGFVFRSFMCSECGRFVQRHAGVWQGSANSFVRLHAKQHDYTLANGTDGTQHVGYGSRVTTGYTQALLWNGTGFAVTLHPSGGYDTSMANAVSGGQQVGSVSGQRTDWNGHAALWKGTAASFVDLNPPNYYQSNAYSVRNGIQVGAGSTLAESWRYRALLWRGTRGSVVDLHAALPAQYQSWNSSAEDIDERGNIVGLIEMGGEFRPVVWQLTKGTRR